MASTTWVSELPSSAAARCADARSVWSILMVRCGRRPAALATRRCGNGGGGSQFTAYSRSSASRSWAGARRRTRACTACRLTPRASASGRSGQPASFSAASVADSNSLRPEERSSRRRAAIRSGSTSRGGGAAPAAAPGGGGGGGGPPPPVLGGFRGVVPPDQHCLHVLAQPVGHHLGHRPALAGQARPQALPLLLVQPEGQQPPGALRVHLAAARARSGTGSGSMAATVCSASTRSRYRRVSAE